jgi:hypothetical protein
MAKRYGHVVSSKIFHRNLEKLGDGVILLSHSRNFAGARPLTLALPTYSVGTVGVLFCCDCAEVGGVVLKH